MKIKNLASIPVEEVIDCFLAAFKNYFVTLPTDVNYWKSRFFTARVDWELSFGMYDGQKLVGFIINCIDLHHNKLTGYNTGTGVLPQYRGNAIVDQLYAHALPQFNAKGIEKCLLEVICENKKAIKVYERIGFKITKELNSFRGDLPQDASEKELQKCHFSEVLNSRLYNAAHYSWDNAAEAVMMSQHLKTYCFRRENAIEAYFVIDKLGNIIQLESQKGDFEELLLAAGNIFGTVQLKNVDKSRTDLIKILQKWHFSNPVNQYEMEMFLKPSKWA